MERDVRRDRSQWRGCHTFNNIICDGDQVGASERSGGLKMGRTYYYYYELDGSTETHDPSIASTTACPYLPGQTVNTLEVPRERQLRHRSASMNSLRPTDYKTMDPKAKFTTPRPAPPVPGQAEIRVRSSPSMTSAKRTSRSPSPKWTGAARRFLGGLKHHQHRDHERGAFTVESEIEALSLDECSRSDGARSATPSGSSRSRDMSPESLRRFLLGSDDRPDTPVVQTVSSLAIPDDIVEETEDEDNFATSAVSETAPITSLSPPPFLRSASSTSSTAGNKNASTATMASRQVPPIPSGPPPPVPNFKVQIPRSRFSTSTTSSSVGSPTSPKSTESGNLSQLSFYDSEDEDNDYLSDIESHVVRRAASQQNLPRRTSSLARRPFQNNYSLPQVSTDSPSKTSSNGHKAQPSLGSPALISRSDDGAPIGNTNLLSLPHVDAGLDDLVSDMGWMADVVRAKDI
ncbi:hypothetical protein F4780DRAFT_667249 [Xylariomycetidae sp. FL0641]|nr:hypothetical protein F4780DRAFT_667249 [Xylariomycetidae sp. FL0641]